MAKLSSQLMVRLDEDSAKFLGEFCDRTGLSATDIARGLIRGFLQTVAQEGEVTFPLAVVPASYLRRLEAMAQPLAAEAAAGEGYSVQANPTAVAHAAHPASTIYPKVKPPRKAKGNTAPK